MFQQYLVIDDKLVPEDAAPLILSEKLGGRTDLPVEALVLFADDSPWKVPDTVTAAERGAGIPSESSARIMIEKMAAVNKLKKTVFHVRIYPEPPAVRVITRTKMEYLFQS